MSEDRSFDLLTALFHVAMYRQYAQKVGTSANSTLIRYYLPRLKLSIALLSRKRGNERLVLTNQKCAVHQLQEIIIEISPTNIISITSLQQSTLTLAFSMRHRCCHLAAVCCRVEPSSHGSCRGNVGEPASSS